ncbi:MAG: acetyl-CoA carboxylase biotin carboxyl carrier protein subunit [Bacteroidota bacterium]|uniref:Biotin carboxyl carrier protein n=1 Tax=Algoriphagus faecimaris TaxID=686796 RepID=A0A1G6P7I1_9BACT|nr:acetyl-CoA carboxylase biotin carboxyl carrier protein subunit [Algoriphagus faecimaris]SDC75377.1 biotin carboxyl carrier protein [Algoriphagus faecimaris]
MFSATLNNKTFSVEKTDKSLKVNDQILDWDIQWISDRKIHLIKDGCSLDAELVGIDKTEKKLQIKLNNKISEIQLKDRFDRLLEELGMTDLNQSNIQDIKAPMPGLILDLKVAPGDEVKKGDVVLILEAMKMENIIKAPGDGVVKEVKVSLKQSVEKNQVMITF